ncbi:MAG: neutral zinc metallopeptidase [Synechococcus sp.]|nr:neutral zinc metallopeptidase [Synechococcus sp.]
MNNSAEGRRSPCDPAAVPRRRRRWLALALAVWFGAATVPVQASTSQRLFLSTLADLRRLDASLRDVRAGLLSGPGSLSGCGKAPQGDLVLFYCPRDRTVYALPRSIDLVANQYGEAGVRYLAAHEMAHGRQHAITGYAREIVRSAVLDELQADCIAGAYLNRLYGYTVESAAGRQALAFAYSIGDRAFYSRDWHGNPRLRLAALGRGLRQGDPGRCLSSSRFNYATLLQAGNAWLQQLRRPRQP